MKAFVVALRFFERRSVLQANDDAAEHFVRKAPAEGILCLDMDLPQEILDVLPADPFRRVLLRHNAVVKDRDSQHIGQAVVSFFFRPAREFSTARGPLLKCH